MILGEVAANIRGANEQVDEGLGALQQAHTALESAREAFGRANEGSGQYDVYEVNCQYNEMLNMLGETIGKVATAHELNRQTADRLSGGGMAGESGSGSMASRTTPSPEPPKTKSAVVTGDVATQTQEAKPEQVQAELDDEDQRAADEVILIDPVRAYLEAIGTVPLIEGKEHEAELSKTIEAGVFAGQLLRAVESDDDNARDLLLRQFVHGPHADSHNEWEQWTKRPITAGQRAEFDAMLERLTGTAEQRAALREMAAEGKTAENDFWAANLRLVVSIAKHYKGMPLLDLIQEGNFGLRRAVEKFDHAKGWKFSTYATNWIHQAINRGLANDGSLVRKPVHMVTKINKVRSAQRELEKKLDREPTTDEIAREANLPADKVVEFLNYAREPVSLDATLGNPDGGNFTLVETSAAASQPSPFKSVSQIVATETVRQKVAALDERTAAMLALRFGQDLNHEQIAELYGVTRERVSYIINRALNELGRDPAIIQAFKLLDD